MNAPMVKRTKEDFRKVVGLSEKSSEPPDSGIIKKTPIEEKKKRRPPSSFRATISISKEI